MGLEDDVAAALKEVRQGDLIQGLPLTILADLAHPLSKEAKEGHQRQGGELGGDRNLRAVRVESAYVVVVSQSCDIVAKPELRPTLVVAATNLSRMPSSYNAGTTNERRAQAKYDQIANGRRAHFCLLHPPGLGSELETQYIYADLSRVSTIDKPAVIGLPTFKGFSKPDDYAEFAFRAGHIYDRPAVAAPADNVLVNPLRDFFVGLADNDAARHARLVKTVDHECLTVDDLAHPTSGTLWFLGNDEPPPADVVEILEEWWQSSLDHTHESGFAIQPNRYECMRDISGADYKAMTILKHWYLSLDDPSQIE